MTSFEHLRSPEKGLLSPDPYLDRDVGSPSSPCGNVCQVLQGIIGFVYVTRYPNSVITPPKIIPKIPVSVSSGACVA